MRAALRSVFARLGSLPFADVCSSSQVKTRASSFRLLAAMVAGFVGWALRGARHSEADLLAECGTLPRFTYSESGSEGGEQC